MLDDLWGGPETLVVISSDLSHYHDYATAERLGGTLYAHETGTSGIETVLALPLRTLLAAEATASPSPDTAETASHGQARTPVAGRR